MNFIYNRNCIKLIICSMSKMDFGMIHLEIGLLYAYTLVLYLAQNTPLAYDTIVKIFFFLCLYNLVTFGVHCSKQIAAALKINILFV